jgi:hypothetical protein
MPLRVLGSWLSYGLLGSYTYSLRILGMGPLDVEGPVPPHSSNPPRPGLGTVVPAILAAALASGSPFKRNDESKVREGRGSRGGLEKSPLESP